ncbi:MAG: hypothetical protein KDD47_17185, partial [Acidobacteria bacterium]|nr:hypothetical protein [Acidobacteriota bacterium]
MGRLPAALWLVASGLLAGAHASPVLGLDASKRISQYRLRSWSLDEGLPQSTVRAITQTPDGYLWLGTLDGLVRFDGVRFSGPASWPGLPRVPSEVVATDSRGRLWVGCREGLFRAEGDGFEEVQLAGERISDVAALVARAAGGLWVGRAQESLLVAGEDGGIGVFVDRAGQTIKGVFAAADRSGQTCFISRTGVHCLVGDDTQLLVARLEIAPQGSLLSSVWIGEDGGVWVGTIGEGAVKLRDGVVEARLDVAGGLEVGTILILMEDRHGVLWLADGTSGFARFAGSRLERGLGLQTVQSFFEDREGNLWIGSNSEGLVQLSDVPITVYSTAEGLPLPVVHSVLASGHGSTWVGLEGGGLAEIRNGEVAQVFGMADGLPSLDVMSLAEDREGRLLVGTAGGVVRREAGVFETVPVEGSPPAFSLFEDSRGALWGGFLREVRRFTDGAFRSVVWGRDRYVGAISETANGAMWFGGSEGLLRWSAGTGEAQAIIADPPVPLVLALLADGDDLWVGTHGGGLGRWQGESGYSSLGRDQGLCDDDVFSLLADDQGHLWMSSNRGVFVVETADARAVLDGSKMELTCRLFGRAQGMRQREASGGTQP